MTFSLGDLHFLLVGNNQHMRRLLRTILSTNGAEIIAEVRDGQEAIGALRLDRPDLIIAEWSMAPMNGLELARYIRHSKKSQAPDVPIILLAGANGDLRELAAEAGASEVVQKPLHADILLDCIRRLTALAGGETALHRRQQRSQP